MIQAIKAVCNKEMEYLVFAKKSDLPRFTLYDYVRSNWDPSKPPSQNWGVSQLFLQLSKRSLLNVSY